MFLTIHNNGVVAGMINEKIDGKSYLYFEYFADDATKQKYCGCDGTRKATLKVLKLEYEHVKNKRSVLNTRLTEIKREIKNKN